MLFHRLAYPVRYSDMVNSFTRPVPVISNITNRDLDYIYETHQTMHRPDENHRIFFHWHKRVHVIKFQSVALPNGLTGHLYGPAGDT